LSLKSRLYGLTILLHLILLVAAYWYIDDAKLEFVFVEIVLVISLVAFTLLIRKILAPFQYVDLFSEVLNEQEFTTRFSHTGNRELDNLMSMFNQMLNQLYEERLKLGDRKGMLQQLLDSIPSAILIFDYSNTISQLNPTAEKLLQVNEDKVKGFKLEALTHPIAKDLSLLELGKSKLINDTQGNRFRCQKNRFKDRGFDRSFIIVQELTTELKASEKQAYEKVIRLMSHEVNNTMAATSSMLKSCLHYSKDINPDERSDFVDAIQLAIERTQNLNQFMQDYAQVVRLPEPSLESCNLYHLLLSMEKLFEEQFKKANISFELPNIQPEQTSIQADKNQLEQVIINIIKNALEAIGDNGNIRSQIVSNEDSIKLRILDSGPGISQAEHKNIFTPFYTTKSDGQGIGLMLVREILEAHKFPFRLYNHEEGGACFEVIF